MALRPSFETTSEVEIEMVRARLAAALARDDCGFRGVLREGSIEIARRGETRFWTPQLRARLQGEGGHTEIRGRFSPAPEMWTLYVVIYLHLAFAALGAILFGTAQAILGSTPWGFWITGVALLAAAAIHRFAAYVGQRFGADEMTAIAAFVRDTINSPSKSAERSA